MTGKLKEQSLIGRPSRRCEDKKDVKEMGCEGMESIHVDQDQWRDLLNKVTNILILRNTENLLTSCSTNITPSEVSLLKYAVDFNYFYYHHIYYLISLTAGYYYGVVSHKASHEMRPFVIYCASPPEF
jgi:hypothetical protein